MESIAYVRARNLDKKFLQNDSLENIKRFFVATIHEICARAYRKASEKQKQLWKEEYEDALVKGKIVRLTFEG